MNRKRYRNMERLRTEFAEKKAAIRSRLEAFGRIGREEVFFELAYCLLTPQSSAVNAAAAMQALRKARCFTRPARSAAILRCRGVRFHNTKAVRLAGAWKQFPELSTRLASGAPGEELRLYLVQNVNGLGWKEASHFLRNIGYRNLAILDRHILRNLRSHGILAAIPATLTPRRYLSIERRFRQFARTSGITMDELDLLFWSRETGAILK
jgi:N-glycosylase/DNA lyase